MQEKRKATGARNPIDVHVGMRLWLQRTLLSMSQKQLARAISLTFQQVQKYERGANRVSASRLYDFSRILNVPISYFFEGADDAGHVAVSTDVTAGIGPKANKHDPMMRRETLELVRAYYRIFDPATRKHILQLVEAMAQTDLHN